jgi:hypothetical protein
MVNSLGRASRFLFPIRFPRGGAEGERAGAREQEGCRRRIQSCVGTDANLPFWAPCLSGLPILLQHRGTVRPALENLALTALALSRGNHLFEKWVRGEGRRKLQFGP